jgi:hypothetical protein
LIPGLDGEALSRHSKDSLWAKFFIGAPQQLRRFVERYSTVKRACGAGEALRRRVTRGLKGAERVILAAWCRVGQKAASGAMFDAHYFKVYPYR